MISLICRVKKIIQMNLFTKETHRLREQTIVIRGEEGRERGNNWEFGRLSEEKKAGREGIDWEFGIDMYTLLYLK